MTMGLGPGPFVVGVDVGGTFTDLMVQGPRGLVVVKLPTTNDPHVAVVDGLKASGVPPGEVSLVCHATTLATNALLTRSGLPRTALITNEGFRDLLEIGRQRRPELYDLHTRRPPPLVRRRDRLTLSCRLAADGSEVDAFDESSARSLASAVVRAGFQSVAICFLNSYVNGAHEVKMKKALEDEGFQGHISVSSEVDREYREYERTSTTAVNAVLSPLMTDYLRSLGSSLKSSGVEAPIYVMSSDGGASTLAFASSRPVSIIESGPAAGVIASKLLAKDLSLPKVLTFDMGGTTAKAGAVVDGEPDVTGEFEAAGKTHSGRSIKGSGYAVRGPFIDLAEVSAGGGTIAWVDDAGDLQVGPRSAGSDPGPACYGRGGTEPTVTDANVVLGRINPEHLLGGKMPISRANALRAMRRISMVLHSSLEETALGILNLVNNKMARAISLVSVERGRDPRDFVIFAFGGGGPGHVCDLAEEIGVDDIVVPLHAGLFSAYGLLAGELTRTFTSSFFGSLGALRAGFLTLEKEARREMKAEGFPSFKVARFVEARYRGQSHELLIPFEGGNVLRSAFDDRHRSLYGYSSTDPVEVVAIKVRASVERSSFGNVGQPPGILAIPRRTRVASVGHRSATTEVISRESLKPGDEGRGPCIIEEYDSTTVVNPSWHWRAEDYGLRVTR